MKFPPLCSMFLLGLALLSPLQARAETKELRIAKQPGLLYLPTILMEKRGLIEKHAREEGLNDFKVSWITFSGGGASTDALLSGGVDFVISGPTNLLLLWDKTKGGIKGVSAVGAAPMSLMTSDPKVHKLADFTDADRIAVPTIKVSAQATTLQIAAEREFGKAGIDRFNALTIAMGHPDAYIQLQNKGSQINSHFSLPPYQTLERKIPGVHEVLSSKDVFGGPVSNGVVFGQTKFHDENPKVIRAFLAALDEAVESIKKDKHAAAEVYLEIAKEKVTVEELTKILEDPDMIYSATPYGSMKMADFMSSVGYIKTKPSSWKDYFFSEVHSLPGS